MDKNNHVYCTECAWLRYTDDGIPTCKHEKKCDIQDAEDSKPLLDRPYYKPAQKWSEEKLISAGYRIENAKVTHVDLSMENHGVICLEMALEGSGWGVVFGGVVLGQGYVGAKKFNGSADGMEYIMRIMDTLNSSKFNDMFGKYVRVATKGWGEPVKIIGNIINDKWFDTESFFNDKQKV